MPVRSLNSSVLKWPDASTVHQAVRDWAKGVVQQKLEVLRIGYLGSYARGDWGVGSDLDLVVVVKESKKRFERRAASWDLTGLPVPVDLLVYTAEEWDALKTQNRFGKTLMTEIVWLYQRE